MDNSCKLKLEWIPAAYSGIAEDGINGTSADKLQQTQPVNGIYQSGKGFTKHKAYRRKS
ncbi:hypothetical protein SNE26_02455 [Mucilaginibacter sp. cycad4]|uniref:hypothetical protein n=1 Tax=Mucilaginibacter sp. cycad4 TaxID=3342096 RepID=UPI002AABAC44|nr:hypothetical protein [Mucilaginibacter gossypii]WPV00627.1 hypothetical protein SNE26_02455 [Mucilaginibacter gossypii]